MQSRPGWTRRCTWRFSVTDKAAQKKLATRERLIVTAAALFQQRGYHAIGVAEILDGVIILLAGAVLITPGILTDAFGFFCLVPAGRASIRRFLKRRFQAGIERGESFVKVDFAPSAHGEKEPMRDVTPHDQL